MVEKYFGSIPAGPAVVSARLQPVEVDSNRYVSYTDNYAQSPMLSVTYPTVPYLHRDMAPLDCLAEILGQGRTSILYKNGVKTQLARQATAAQRNSELSGEFVFTVVPFPYKSLAEMEKGGKTVHDRI
jgi:zinc protease